MAEAAEATAGPTSGARGRWAPLVRALPVVVLVVAPFLAFVRVWAGTGDLAAHFMGDTTGSYWPDLVFFHRAFADGSFPLWNPLDRGGYPFCADPQTGVLYPVNWLLAGLGFVLGGMPFGLLQAKVLLHLSLAGVAMYAFLRGRSLPRTAALAGGLAYQFGPFLMHNAHFALVWPAAWFPLVLWGIDRVFARPGWRSGALLGGAAGLVMVAGSPPTAWYGVLVAFPYFLLRLVGSMRGERLGAWVRAVGPGLGVAAALAAVLALPNLLATAVLTKHSVLSVRDFAYVSDGSLGPADLLGLVVRSGKNLYLYAGVTSLLLAAIGVVRARPRREVVFFGIVAVVGVVLALGQNTHLLRLCAALCPPFTLFRLPFRYLFLLNVALAPLVAYGVAALLRHREETHDWDPRRLLRGATRVLAIATGLAVFLRIAGKIVDKAHIVTDLWLVLLFAWLVLLALWARVRWHRRGARWAEAAVIVVMLLDFSTHAQRAGLLRKGAFEAKPYLPEPTMASLHADAQDHRVWAEFALCWRPGSRLGLRDFRGYMDPLRLGRYARIVEALHRTPKLIGLFNVRHLLHGPHPYHGKGHNHIKDPRRIPGAKRLERGVWELPDAAPYAYWVGTVQRVATDAEALARLAALEPGRQVVVAEEDLDDAARAYVDGLPEASLGTPPRVAAQVVARRTNTVTLRVEAPGPGLLVVNEAWFPGWTADIDGAATPLWRANSLVQALPIAAGTHEIHLAFRPAYFLVPAWTAALSVLGLLGVAIISRSRRRRRATPKEGEAV